MEEQREGGVCLQHWFVCVCVGEKGTCAQSSSRARKLECEGVETEGGTLLTRDLEALKCEPQIKFDI